MSQAFNNQDLEAFLIEAELVNQKVKALANNQLSPEEFDRLQVARKQDLRKRTAAKQRKQIQQLQKRKRGVQGKGIGKNFKNFCRFCHWQYEFQTPTCLRCKKPTMTLQQRQQQLEVMVRDYKQKKKSRQQRKMKWEMWKKTKSMLWKKTSNTYDKWDYFVSDSQEQTEQDPIVPSNDPNFKALEKDIQQRKLQRKKDNDNAKRLKQKGNQEMKNGNYAKAIQYYHLALEHIKDMKSIYTNRALAYIKLKKYDKAIKDCNNVIEYAEVFGKTGESYDLLFKAYLRRASALKEKKQYKKAQQDVSKAQEIYPKDQNCRILKKELQGFIAHQQKIAKLLRQNKSQQVTQQKSQQVAKQQPEQEQQQIGADAQKTQAQIDKRQKQIVKQLAEAEMKEQKIEEQKKQSKTTKQEKIDTENKQQIKQEIVQKTIDKDKKKTKKNNSIEKIKQILDQKSLSHSDIQELFLMIRANQQNLAIFLAAKGPKKCIAQLVESQQTKKEGYLISCSLRGDGVGQQQIWEFGVQKIHGKIIDILKNPSQMNLSLYFLLQDLFEVLIPISLHQKYRPLIAGSQNTFNFFENTFSRLITRHKKQPDLLSSFLIYAGNICSGNSKLRDSFITPNILRLLVSSLYEKILTRKTANRSYLNLKKNVYGFYANLLINQNHRKTFCEYFNEIEQNQESKAQRWQELIKEVRTYPRSQQNFKQYIESILSVFTNVSLGTKLLLPNLVECLNSRFLENPQSYNSQILNRSLLILIRVKHNDLKQFSKIMKNINKNIEILNSKKQIKIMEQMVRLLNVIYMPIEIKREEETIKTIFTQPLPANIFQQLIKYISSLQYGEVLFCNTCNLFSVLIGSGDVSKQAINNKQFVLNNLKPHMKFLIQVAKQKIGNWRKNASILLAKMSLDQRCRQQLNKNHGMDVLRSIAQYVKD